MIHASPELNDGNASRPTQLSGDPIDEARIVFHRSDLEAIGIETLLSRLRAVGTNTLRTLSCRGDGAVIEATVETESMAEQLSSIDAIDTWIRVTGDRETTTYMIDFTASNFPPSIANQVDALLGTCNPELTEHGMTVSLLGPREAIADVVERFVAAGLSPDLRKLGSYDAREHPLDQLTGRQRKVLETAYEMGYFEVPRTGLAEDVAAELGIESSTVHEHLQRAQRNLFSHYLATDA